VPQVNVDIYHVAVQGDGIRIDLEVETISYVDTSLASVFFVVGSGHRCDLKENEGLRHLYRGDRGDWDPHKRCAISPRASARACYHGTFDMSRPCQLLSALVD
jgi:hypothetical protein